MTLHTPEEGLCSSFLFIAFVHFSPPLQSKDIPARNAPHEAHTPALPFHGRILVSFAGNFVGSETLPSLVEIMRLQLHLPHVLNQVHYPSPFFRCFLSLPLSLFTLPILSLFTPSPLVLPLQPPYFSLFFSPSHFFFSLSLPFSFTLCSSICLHISYSF